MAWIEQTGTRSWRVRYLRHPGHYGDQRHESALQQ